MNFAEQLKAKKDLKVIEFANEFLGTIKASLIESAEQGYSAYKYRINLDSPAEKEKLQLYSDKLFVEHLNKNLDGVKASYETEYVENLLFKGCGWYKHYLIFKW
ncbi:hypothetical protein [Schinkia azotoformans]|uniref:hypothetical protein n=1 Tax=Schinkia azotoformans TaxID=1454 RepID=UPI002DBF99A9|nr:hypothetical protein [Schinkia azotoformans]MEC1772822.1 hypothetical protein [Schinkia azotoformans]MED4367459.1 hypothetical protein [Schinkia azotoformans]